MRGLAPVIRDTANRARSGLRIRWTESPGSDSTPTASADPNPSITLPAASSTTFSLPGAIESRSTTTTTMRPSSLPFMTGPEPAGSGWATTSMPPSPKNRTSRTRRGLPSSVTVKSSGLRSMIGLPARSRTDAWTVSTSTRARKIGVCGSCAATVTARATTRMAIRIWLLRNDLAAGAELPESAVERMRRRSSGRGADLHRGDRAFVQLVHPRRQPQVQGGRLLVRHFNVSGAVDGPRVHGHHLAALRRAAAAVARDVRGPVHPRRLLLGAGLRVGELLHSHARANHRAVFHHKQRSLQRHVLPAARRDQRGQPGFLVGSLDRFDAVDRLAVLLREGEAIQVG